MKQYTIHSRHLAGGSTQCATLDIGARYSYPCLVLFYPGKLDEHRLRQALARVLDHFPVYAGKFVLDAIRLTIQHTGGPVVFESERSSETIEVLAAQLRAGRAQLLEPRLSKLRILRADEVTLAVRFTEARDGCVLTVAWNHAVGDTHSTMLLMRAWADAYAGRAYDLPLHVNDRDAYLRAVMPDPQAARSAAGKVSWLEATRLRMALMRPAVRVTVEYSWVEATAIHAAMGGLRRVGLNDAVCAHVYTVLRRLAGITERTQLSLVVNFRKRVGLSNSLIGNMTTLLVQPVEETDTPAEIAAGIRDGLEHYATRHVNYQATMRVFDANTRTSERGRLICRQFIPGSGDLLVTNWNKFGFYDLAFDALKPVLFYPQILGLTRLTQWCMIVYDLPASRGLGITVGLPSAVAERWSSPAGQVLLHRPQPAGDVTPLPMPQPLPA